jgi:hypothetical protein
MIATPKRSIGFFVFMVAMIYLDYEYSIMSDFADMFRKNLQKSHAEANVPERDEFSEFIQRDLQSYFNQQLNRTDIKVNFELLRKGATQSGVALPKYYAWANVFDSLGNKIESGAVRLAAVEGDHFEITDFVKKTSILEKSVQLADIFPALLVDKIILKAEEK